MAELPNRADYEREIALALSQLNERHRVELRSLLGTPPDVRNVPDEFWHQVRQDVAAELGILLLLVYTESAQFHGLGEGRAAQLGVAWADERAAWVADRYVENSQDMLRRASERWAEEAKRPQEVGVGGQDTGGGFGAGEDRPSGGSVPESTIENDIDSIFGEGRQDRVANNETGEAQKAGGEGWREDYERKTGVKVDVIWRHSEHRPRGHAGAAVDPCKVCTPLEGTGRDVWALAVAGGPPAHPHCDCYLEYQIEGKIIDFSEN